jgi:TRAP-type uncharacterized transport system substrate-binding protein
LAFVQRLGCDPLHCRHRFVRGGVFYSSTAATTVTIATAFKGSTFVYYGEKYREIFARSHVKLELRETNGAVDNLRLLQDPKSGVDIGFVNGGVSQGNPPPGLLSIGLMYNNAFWIFYRSTETLDRLVFAMSALPSKADIVCQPHWES